MATYQLFIGEKLYTEDDNLQTIIIMYNDLDGGWDDLALPHDCDGLIKKIVDTENESILLSCRIYNDYLYEQEITSLKDKITELESKLNLHKKCEEIPSENGTENVNKKDTFSRLERCVINFQKIRHKLNISNIAADLYIFLLCERRMKRGMNEFYLETNKICTSLNISNHTLIKARNELNNLNFIYFTQGLRNEKKPSYKINDSIVFSEISS